MYKLQFIEEMRHERAYVTRVCQNALFLKNHKAPTFTSQGFAMSKEMCNFKQKF